MSSDRDAERASLEGRPLGQAFGGGAIRETESGLAPPSGEGARAVGWSLPLVPDASGRLPGERRDPVGDTARLVLELVPGERRLLPRFGCRIHGLESLESTESRQLGAALLEEALREWAPALRVERVEIVDVREGEIDVRLRAAGSWHALRVRHRPAREGDEGDERGIVDRASRRGAASRARADEEDDS